MRRVDFDKELARKLAAIGCTDEEKGTGQGLAWPGKAGLSRAWRGTWRGVARQGTAGRGVAVEMEMAHRMGKPVLLLAPVSRPCARVATQ